MLTIVKAADRKSWAGLSRFRIPCLQACLIFQFDFFLLLQFCKCTWAELIQTQAGDVSEDPSRQIKLFERLFWWGSQVARGAKWELWGWGPANRLDMASLCVALETLGWLKAETEMRMLKSVFVKVFWLSSFRNVWDAVGFPVYISSG